MDGKCFSCATKFGFFKKEHSCKNCGFNFCKSCIPHEVKIPSKGPNPQSVCKKCFKLLSEPPDEQKENKLNEGRYSPPENFKKRVAALKEKDATKSTTSGQQQGSPRTHQKKHQLNLAPEDRQIAERLEKLKEDQRNKRGPVPSIDEMERRLRALKEQSEKSDTGDAQTQSHQTPDTRSSYEQTQDLLSQMTEEVSIDHKCGGGPEDQGGATSGDGVPQSSEFRTLEEEANALIAGARHDIQMESEGRGKDDDMEARLAKLQGMGLQAYRDKGKQELMDMSEEEATRRYIAKLLEEERLDQHVSEDGYADLLSQAKDKQLAKQKHSVDPDELPWCSICNDDATLRCHGCEGDLYCRRCFREGHDDFDMKDHQTSSYKPPKDGNK